MKDENENLDESLEDSKEASNALIQILKNQMKETLMSGLNQQNLQCQILSTAYELYMADKSSVF